MSQIRPGRLCVLTCIALLTAWLPARAETLTLFWDPNPEPTVVGYVVYIGPGMGSYTERIDVGAATHYDFTAAPGTTHCFAVAAYSGGSMEGDRSREVCAAGNAAPTLANPGDQTSPIGQVLSLSLSGVDPEGAPLTYTVTGLPAGLTVMQATGIVIGTPTQSGSTTVNATVSDGQSSATVSFLTSIRPRAFSSATPRIQVSSDRS